MAVVDTSRITEPLPLINWGAIFAGLFFVITASWLLFLLGSAVGVGIADASDLEAMGKGFGVGAAIWLILSTIVVYFLGGWLAARVAGNPNTGNGVLHGLVLWSAVGVLILLLGSLGVSNAMQAGQSLITGAASVAKSAAQGAGAAGSAAADAGAGDSQLMQEIQAMIKQRAAAAVAQAGADVAAEGGGGVPPVSEGDLRQAIENMDAQTLTQVTRELIAGNTEGAKSTVAANTNLSEQQINSLIDGLAQTVNERKEQAQQQIKETTEKVSSYTQAVIWAMFLSSLLGLAAALMGGGKGARPL